MCGFLGSSFNEDIQEFTDLLILGKFRGPDSTQTWENINMRLGFNRLAIQDLSRNGDQPMYSNSKSWIIVFNGEIYNHKDIRENLYNYQFNSDSDTETILAAIEEFGFDKTIKLLNGMFAIAAYNLIDQKLFLARDFSGIKPLYYAVNNENIIFASQFNQIFKHSVFWTNLVLRPEIMKEYFALGYMHAPNTIYEGIFQVEPGQLLVWDLLGKKICKREYFYTWLDDPILPENNHELVKEFNDLFGDVVKEQLISDVPVASFLSGGIDSPLVTAHAKNANPNIKAFTMGVNDKTLDESKYASDYANYLKVEHIIENFSENELLDVINSHFDFLPEPHGDYSSIPTFLVCKKARQYATVMLSGDGGDELFWGYPRFNRTISHLNYFRIPGRLRKGIFYILRRFGLDISYAINKDTSLGQWILNKQIHLDKIDSIFPKHQFSKELLDLYSISTASKSQTLLKLRKNEFYGHLQRVLRKVDLMSMGNSLEVRVPFLDKKTIEFSQKISPQLGIKHLTNKLILKNSLSKFIPEYLIMKGKKGFTVPLKEWFMGPLREDLEYCLLKLEIYGSDNLNTDIIKSELNNFFNGIDVSEWGIWHIYSWQKWALANGLIKK
jgi:asparagine synthase (glutamine-hydrolysing)